MASFELYGKYDIAQEGLTAGRVFGMLKESLSNHYGESAVRITPTGVVVEGDLKSFWERAITKAEAKVEIKGNQLVYRVNGESEFGNWPWFCLFIGFFIPFFTSLFVIWLIEYIISRDRPKRYFEEALKKVEFEVA